MARAPRPPVIAVMGHIDHGKSSLLDYIRKENVVATEAGGITQHVSAYIIVHNGRKITFLDTPGHEAFKALRARGAQAADIAILVVAADEGVMPQTLDALSAIKGAKIPFVVAITKIDKNNADVERAKMSLLEHEVLLEGLGGDIPYALVSSKTGEGVSELLDLVLLASDLIDLSADPTLPASGFVLESTQDPRRGASATLITKDGTLKIGGFVIAGDAYAPVRFIENFLGERTLAALPAEPARIAGFSKLPPAGTPFLVVKTKKEAESQLGANVGFFGHGPESPAGDAPADAGILPIVVKADVAGSVDAILHELGKLPRERATVRVLSSGVGSVSEGDVKAASAAGGVILAFHVDTDAPARELAFRDRVPIETFSIIYELSARAAELLALRAPKVEGEVELGRARVLKTFSSASKKQVLGLAFVSGKLAIGDQIKIVRKDAEIARGKIAHIEQARATIKEIKQEGEYGIEVEAREDAAPGDFIVSFTIGAL